MVNIYVSMCVYIHIYRNAHIYVSKVEPRLSAGLDLYERKRKLDIELLQIFGLSNWKNAIYYNDVEGSWVSNFF